MIVFHLWLYTCVVLCVCWVLRLVLFLCVVCNVLGAAVKIMALFYLCFVSCVLLCIIVCFAFAFIVLLHLFLFIFLLKSLWPFLCGDFEKFGKGTHHTEHASNRA